MVPGDFHGISPPPPPFGNLAWLELIVLSNMIIQVALLANGSKQLQDLAFQYGKNLGMAFQVSTVITVYEFYPMDLPVCGLEIQFKIT